MASIFKYFFLVISFLALVDADSVYQLANWQFYLYIGLMILDFLDTKSITLLQVWILAFIFVVLSEMLVYSELTSKLDLNSAVFLVSANNLVLLGYLLGTKLRNTKGANFSKQSHAHKLAKWNSRLIMLVIVIFLLVYVIYFLPNAIVSFTSGRNASMGQSDSSVVWGSILASIGLVLPAIIAY